MAQYRLPGKSNPATVSAAASQTDFVFDVAGVLLHWDPSALYQDFFEGDASRCEFFLTQVMDAAAQRQISAGASLQTVLAGLAELFPDYEDALRAWLERWPEMLVGEIEGTVAALGELRERGYRTFALGNWSREEFDLVSPRFEFLNQFNGVLLSGDCGLLKPDERIYRLAEERFSLTPANTVFIDDREDNALAAVARGWNALVFESPRQLYLTLMDYGFL